MLEDLLLLKKIADYFKKINKLEIADIIDKELQEEVKFCPEFVEPEYVNEDLQTIFTKHVKNKRRKSEALLRKSNQNNSTKINSKRKIVPSDVNSLVTNICNKEDKENRNNVDCDISAFDSEFIVPSSQLCDETVHKSRFFPAVASTPYNKNIENNVTNVIKEEEVNYDAYNDDQSMIIEDLDNYHQTVNDAGDFLENYDNNMNQILEDYENVFRPSQASQQTLTLLHHHRTGSHGSSSIVSENCPVNDNLVNEEYSPTNLEELATPSEDRCQSIFSSNKELVENSLPPISNDSPIENVISSRKTEEPVDLPPLSCGQLVAPSNEINSGIGNHSESVKNNELHEEISEKQLPSVTKETHEISIQCDPFDLMECNEIPIQKRGHESITEEVGNVKKPRLENKEIEIIDLDVNEMVQDEDLLLTQETRIDYGTETQLSESIITEEETNESHMMNIGEITDLDQDTIEMKTSEESRTGNRSRHSSLSSLDDQPEVTQLEKPLKSKKKTEKPFIIYKEDKRLDLQKRVLLSDGWLLWPTSLLSGCLRHYDVDAFRDMLGIEEDDDQLKVSIQRKRFLDQCLQEMSRDNLIHEGFCKSKKMNFYIKFASLSQELLEKYDISEAEYTDTLWYKNMGPKTGRKLCVELAPEVMKKLITFELTYAESLIESED